MEIKYVAFDSLGVKSSCVFVETEDIKICIDPGVAIETGSFPLPEEVREEKVAEYKEKIAEACKKADIIIISHYHYDHHLVIPEWYEGKTLLVKDPENKINKSQRKRSSKLLDKINAKEIKIADSEKFKFGKTEIKFSKPLAHGLKGTKLGYVLMTKISEGEYKMLHTSDLDGPSEEEHADIIIKENPSLLILDGAPTYLLGFIHSYYNLCRAVLNLRRIIRESDIEKIILDHHALRDYRYKDFYYLAFQEAEKQGVELQSAAEEIGLEPAVIEGYKKYGSTKWKNWRKLTEEKMKKILKNAKENDLLDSRTIKFAESELGKLD
ncbi:MAG: MBL fold metallo-hydrolase [Candidatus Undinarchaeales archaeon]